jgi:hypothetical protein
MPTSIHDLHGRSFHRRRSFGLASWTPNPPGQARPSSDQVRRSDPSVSPRSPIGERPPDLCLSKGRRKMRVKLFLGRELRRTRHRRHAPRHPRHGGLRNATPRRTDGTEARRGQRACCAGRSARSQMSGDVAPKKRPRVHRLPETSTTRNPTAAHIPTSSCTA